MALTIVGRKHHLDRIALIGDSAVESGLLVVGEHGSGKTHLLEAAQAESAIRAVLIRTNPAEAGWSLSGFSTLFASLNDTRAVEFSGRFALRSTEPADVFAASRELLSVVRGLSLDPILVLIDDIDKMDPESQLLIGFMAGRMAGTGMRIVATAQKINPASPLAGFPYLTLDPLTPAEALELAKLVTGPNFDDGTLQFVAAEGDGLPLAIVEIAQLLNDNQIRGRHALALPFRPSGAVRTFAEDRLGNVSASELMLLERLSLAPLENLAALTSSAADEVDTIDELVLSDLVIVQGTYIRLANPLLRSYLYWRMDAGKRRQLHLEMAEANAGIDSKLEVWHASFARDDDETHAVRLLDAAVDFVVDGQTRAATEFAERALIIESETVKLLPGIIRLVDGWLRQGELALASRYILHANVSGANAEFNLRLATLRAGIEYTRTWVVPDHEIDMSAGIYQDEDPEGASRLFDFAALCHAQRWEAFEAREYLAKAENVVRTVETTDRTRSMHSLTTGLVDALEGRRQTTEGAVADSEAFEAMPSSSVELTAFGQQLSYRERYAAARGVYARLLTKHAVAEPLWQEFGRFLAAMNEIRSGNFHQATSAVEEWSQNTLPQLGTRSSRLFFRAWLATATDRQDEAEEFLLECHRRTAIEGNQAVNGWVLTLQGSLAQIDGDEELALEYLDQVDLIGERFANPALLRHSADLVQAYVAVGRTADARRVHNRMVEKWHEHPSRWLTLAIARAEAAMAPDATSVELFRHAMDLFGPADSRYELAKTIANFASKQAILGLAQESLRTFAAARSAFEQAGAPAWGSRLTGAELRPSTTPESLIAVLTDDERQVAELVLRGYRNKEIAAALFISLRSVELRLTRIYRKVGARSRSHLVALLT